MLFHTPQSFVEWNNSTQKCCSVNWQTIEVDITYDCDMGCSKCNRACDIAKSKERIEVNQLKSLIEDTQNFRRTFIMGGDPVLHPEIVECVKLFPKNRRPIIRTRLPLQHATLREISPFVKIRRSVGGVSHFNNFTLAPIDIGITNHFEIGCPQVSRCGRGVTPWGFYPAASCGGVDRVFGFDVGIKDIKDFNEDNIREQCKVLCRYCGIFLRNLNIKKLLRSRFVSHSWARALEKYKESPPRLTRYKSH